VNNIEILAPVSGPEHLRMFLRNVVAVNPERDPVVVSPLGDSFALGTTRGRVRDANEDRVAIMRVCPLGGDRPWIICAVSDGIGGMVGGGRAAEISLSTFLNAVLTSRQGCTTENLKQAAGAAHAAVLADFQGRGGATLASFAWDCSRLLTVSVGDSRIWGMGQGPQLAQWTQDDSIAAQLQAQGVPGAEDARRDLLQFIGSEEMAPHIAEQRSDGIRFVIASTDGAHLAPASMLSQIAHNAATSSDIVTRWTDLSLWLGGGDNATIACLEPGKTIGGSPGILELWTASGYWRVVKPDSSIPKAPSSEKKFGQMDPGTAAQTSSDEAKAQFDRERGGGAPGKQQKSKGGRRPAGAKRGKRAKRGLPSDLFDRQDDSTSDDVRKNKVMGHVRVHIGPKIDEGALPPAQVAPPNDRREQ